MANNNKEIHTSGACEDDDPTAELEVLPEAVSAEIKADRRHETESDEHTSDFVGHGTDVGEADETIYSLKSDLISRAETIRELHFEIAQLRPRSSELEKEVRVLEEVMNNVTEELKLAHKKQLDTSKLLDKRDNEIESLKSQLSAKEHALKESDRQIEDAKNKEQESVSLEGEIKQSPVIELRAQYTDTTHANLENETTGLSEVINALKAELDAATKTRIRLDRQVEKATADNALLATELESKQALIDDYEQDIEELRESKLPAGSTRADANDEPQELALLVPLNGTASSGHPIRTGRLSLGSSPDNDIQIKSDFISRHHAQVVSSSTDSILGDLNSTNGTYVNSNRIKRHALRNGDSITIGKHRFRFDKRNPAASAQETDIKRVRFKS